MLNRILSAIGLEKRSTIGVNGWPVPLSASAVTPDSAQSVGACYAAVALIAEAIGSLPLKRIDRTATTARRPPTTLCTRYCTAPRMSSTGHRVLEWMVSSMLLTRQRLRPRHTRLGWPGPQPSTPW